MKIIQHKEVPVRPGYYSRIKNREIVSGTLSGGACEVWDQTIPVDGYIVPHTHEYVETLTILSGEAVLVVNGQETKLFDNSTAVIEPGELHSMQNSGSIPVRLIAYHATSKAALNYPNGKPEPVQW